MVVNRLPPKDQGYHVAAIIAAVQAARGGRSCFAHTDFHYEHRLASTNTWLFAHRPVAGKICIAETQVAGRGRQGKTWQDCVGGSLLLSIGWGEFASPPTALSLVSGIAVVRALAALGVGEVGLKWPNDIMLQGQKIGGILVEIRAPDSVIGIGLNVDLSVAVELRSPMTRPMRIGQPWSDLAACGYTIDRTQLAAQVIIEHETILTDYEQCGFASYVAEWNRWHACDGRTVMVKTAHRTRRGIADGVDASGRLQVRCGDEMVAAIAGEVTLLEDTPWVHGGDGHGRGHARA